MASCGQGREARHRRPRHEGAAQPLRQGQHVGQPGEGDLLEERRDRTRHPHPGVLVPCGRQPVRRDRGRKRAADDEAEVAAAGGGHGGRRAGLVEQSERLQCRLRTLRHRAGQFDETGERSLGRRYGPAVQAIEIGVGPGGRFFQQSLPFNGACLLDDVRAGHFGRRGLRRAHGRPRVGNELDSDRYL